MYTNEYIALQMHKIREAEEKRTHGLDKAIAEAIKLEKEELRRNRKPNK